MISGTFWARYRSDASKIVVTSPSGRWRVKPPSVPGASLLRRRMLANAPRTITSWLPPRDAHVVCAPARPVRVEVGDRDAVLGQVLAGRALPLDRAGRRDVVGRDA